MSSGGASAGLDITAGYMQYAQGKQNARAIDNQNEYNKRIANFNQAMIDVQKDEINAQAQRDIHNRYQDLSRILGTQRVQSAAMNLALDSETVQALREQERSFAGEDVDAIKSNANKAALGLELRKQDIRMDTEMKSMQAKQAARNSITTGGVQFVKSIASASNTMYGG